MPSNSFHISFPLLLLLLLLLLSSVLATATQHHNDLPPGIIRSPLLHEHTFTAPIVNDWWEEGVPHFMIGGAAVANEKFIRLTSNNLGEHGFAFNTAPCDHAGWEARLRFSIRPPLPFIRSQYHNNNNKEEDNIKYEGGEGLALWYLIQPLGDDHQHVPKYSKPIDPNVAEEELMRRNPARVADLLFNNNQNNDEDEDDDDNDNDNDEEKVNETEREQRRVRRLMKQQEREELYRRVFRRGTSTDDSNLEPRMFGLKFSEFNGFGVLLDSVGYHEEKDHHNNNNNNNNNNNTRQHKAHDPRIMVILNLPAKEQKEGGKSGEKPAINNFNARQPNFRNSPVRLECKYDFRQSPTKRAIQMIKMTNNNNNNNKISGDNKAEEEKLLLESTPEEPVELIVRYYNRRLSVMITREDVKRRRVVPVTQNNNNNNNNNNNPQQKYRIEKTYVETLCGELDNVELPLGYHFGISASTGARRKQRQKDLRLGIDGKINNNNNNKNTKLPHGSLLELFRESQNKDYTEMHVDVHDVISFELRELGKDAKAMGYSKSIPIEHFDYEADKKERIHFSRQLPVEPEPDE